MKVAVRTTRAMRLGAAELTAGALVQVEAVDAAELVRTRRATLVDVADLRPVLQAGRRADVWTARPPMSR